MNILLFSLLTACGRSSDGPTNKDPAASGPDETGATDRPRGAYLLAISIAGASTVVQAHHAVTLFRAFCG